MAYNLLQSAKLLELHIANILMGQHPNLAVDNHFHGPYNRGTFMESEVESMDAGGSNGTLAGRSFPATDEPPQGVRRFRMSIE